MDIARSLIVAGHVLGTNPKYEEEGKFLTDFGADLIAGAGTAIGRLGNEEIAGSIEEGPQEEVPAGEVTPPVG